MLIKVGKHCGGCKNHRGVPRRKAVSNRPIYRQNNALIYITGTNSANDILYPKLSYKQYKQQCHSNHNAGCPCFLKEQEGDRKHRTRKTSLKGEAQSAGQAVKKSATQILLYPIKNSEVCLCHPSQLRSPVQKALLNIAS